jgi:hypothetical protein
MIAIHEAYRAGLLGFKNSYAFGWRNAHPYGANEIW